MDSGGLDGNWTWFGLQGIDSSKLYLQGRMEETELGEVGKHGLGFSYSRK